MSTRKPLLLLVVALLLCLPVALSAAAQPPPTRPAPPIYDQLTALPLPAVPLPGSPAAEAQEAQPAAPAAAEYDGDYGPWTRWAIQGYGPEAGWEVSFTDAQIKFHVRLASHPAADMHPKLNRGGTRVVFTSNRDGDFEIYSIAADGSDLRQLTFNDSDDAWPAWSPDSRRIAFQAYRDGQPEVYEMAADGSDQTRLTNSPYTDGMPDWSPDGTRITFAAFRNGLHGIFSMNADGTDQRRLVSAVYAQRPKYSPDGLMIAFDADGDGDTWQDLFVMPAVGGAATMVVDGWAEHELMLGSWSPDGDFLAYTQVNFIEYQGEYYWTESWTYRHDLERDYTEPFYGTVGNLWYGQWQTIDAEPPRVRLSPLPAMMAAGSVRLSWSAEEVGISGLVSYDVEIGNHMGQWQTWLRGQPENYSWAYYDAPPGTTLTFRVRARDAAHNVSPPSAASDTTTFFYSALLAARVTDNRGAPLENARFQRLPDGQDFETGRDGRTTVPMTAAGVQSIGVFHNDFVALAHENRRVQACMVYEPYMLGGQNALTNGELEAGLSGWTAAGSRPPVASADSFRGAGSMRLGAGCATSCLAAPVSLGQSDLTARDIVGDALGNVHVAWGDGTGIYHTMRAPDGTWSEPRALDPGHQAYLPRLAADPAGNLHVLWRREEGGNNGLTYSVRRPDGIWQPATPLPGTASLGSVTALLSDSRGTLYALTRDQSRYHTYLLGKPAGAAWGAAVKLESSLNLATVFGVAAIAPDDRLVIPVLDSINMDEHEIVLLTRTPEGQWGAIRGAPVDAGLDVFDIEIAGNGAIYLISGNEYGGVKQLAYRGPAGTWSESTPLPVDVREEGTVVDSLGRLNVVSWGGRFLVWTPATGWGTPAALDIEAGMMAIDAFDLPHVIGLLPYPAPNEWLYFGPAAATAGTSTLWQQVTIPAGMAAPTLAFMQRRHGELPGGQTELRAFVEEGGVTTPLAVAGGGRAWSLAWVDLSPWQGQTVKVGLTLEQAAGEPAAQAWLDDISVADGFADLAVTVTSRRAVGQGTPLPLRVEVRNQGGVAAADVSLRVSLQDGLTFVSADPPPATVNGQELRWELGDRPAFSPAQTIVVTLTGRTNPHGLDRPYIIDLQASTPTDERQIMNNGGNYMLLIAEQSFLPAVR